MATSGLWKEAERSKVNLVVEPGWTLLYSVGGSVKAGLSRGQFGVGICRGLCSSTGV